MTLSFLQNTPPYIGNYITVIKSIITAEVGGGVGVTGKGTGVVLQSREYLSLILWQSCNSIIDVFSFISYSFLTTPMISCKHH